MQYVAPLPTGKLKFYYNTKVYSPEYSSLEPVQLVNKLLRDGQRPEARVLDVGCGSGVLGLSIKANNPLAVVTLSDISPESVRISKLNAKRLGLAVQIERADLLPPGTWEIIVANLPSYTEEQLATLPLHGPVVAYQGDLSLYARLFKLAKDRCRALVCECQVAQQPRLLQLAREAGYTLLLQTPQAFAFYPYAK